MSSMAATPCGEAEGLRKGAAIALAAARTIQPARPGRRWPSHVWRERRVEGAQAWGGGMTFRHSSGLSSHSVVAAADPLRERRPPSRRTYLVRPAQAQRLVQ